MSVQQSRAVGVHFPGLGSGHVGVAYRIHGYSCERGRVIREGRGKNHLASVGGELSQESLKNSPEHLMVWISGDRKILGIGASGDVGVALRVDSDGGGAVLERSTKQGGEDQVALAVVLCYEGVALDEFHSLRDGVR